MAQRRVTVNGVSAAAEPFHALEASVGLEKTRTLVAKTPAADGARNADALPRNSCSLSKSLTTYTTLTTFPHYLAVVVVSEPVLVVLVVSHDRAAAADARVAGLVPRSRVVLAAKSVVPVASLALSLALNLALSLGAGPLVASTPSVK